MKKAKFEFEVHGTEIAINNFYDDLKRIRDKNGVVFNDTLKVSLITESELF